ncbi:MAG: hypothetical protein JWO10_533 [Microbacteriaceae bacterium]|nr:hypothetical protein [Microbacteriaceae bacterium]
METIEIVKLTGDDWVVSDRRVEETSGCGVVGFVTHIAGLYELTQLTSPNTPQFFATLHDAVDACTSDAELPAAA